MVTNNHLQGFCYFLYLKTFYQPQKLMKTFKKKLTQLINSTTTFTQKMKSKNWTINPVDKVLIFIIIGIKNWLK